MLSKKWVGHYESTLAKFGPELAKRNLPYRIDETNTYYIGGAPGASNSMAAAVWAVDYLYWWAEHGAQGINFHNGTTLPFNKGSLPGGADRKPCYYASFWGEPQGGYSVQAVGYGLKAFSLGCNGNIFPVNINAPANANITAYAVKNANGEVFLTIINKEIDTPAQSIIINQPQGESFNECKSIALSVKDANVAATEGFTLGGVSIKTDASWDGKWTTLPIENNTINFSIAPTSVIILHLKK
jgi:hypothetical protein